MIINPQRDVPSHGHRMGFNCPFCDIVIKLLFSHTLIFNELSHLMSFHLFKVKSHGTAPYAMVMPRYWWCFEEWKAVLHNPPEDKMSFLMYFMDILSVPMGNKRPKGPHIVHLSTMCHLFEESAKADIFVYWSPRKIQTWQRTLRSCFLSSFVEFPFSGFRGEVENVSANQRPGRPSCFSDPPEKNKLGRGRWDLVSCQVLLNSVQRF